MAGQSYSLNYTVDVIANIENVKNAIKRIQNELKNGKFDIELGNSKSFLKALQQAADLSDQLYNKVGTKENPNKMGIKDMSSSIKDYERLLSFVDTINTKLQESYGKSAGTGLVNTAELKKAADAFKILEDAREQSRSKLQKDNQEYIAQQQRLNDLEAERLEAVRQRELSERRLAKERVELSKMGYSSEEEADKYLRKRTSDWSKEQEARYQAMSKANSSLLKTTKYTKAGGESLTIGQVESLGLKSSLDAVKELKALLPELQAMGKIGQGPLENLNFKAAVDSVKEYRKELQLVEKDSKRIRVAQQVDKVRKAKEEVESSRKTENQYVDQINTLNNSLKEMEYGNINFSSLKNSLMELGVSGLEGANTFRQLEAALNTLSAEAQGEAKTALEGLKATILEISDFSAKGKKQVPALFDNLKVSERQIQDLSRLKFQIYDFFSMSNKIRLFRRVLNDAFSTIKELDSVMTETAVVTDFTVSDMWDKLPEYANQAAELGTSISSLYEATTLYYQQGLNSKQAMSVGTETMKMARIANMDAADATEAMTAALRGFNMEINETSATRINDVYSELAAITAADTSQIATAMTKTASIAASANMEFETTAAFLAQIIETTQEAPETAGTAMKTIIARFTEVKELFSEGMLTGEDEEGEVIEINKIDKALQSVGISLKDFLLGKKGIDDIFLELASKWDTLDLATQRYIATTAAGSRQQSRFIAMMSDYGRTTELVSAAQNSSGAGQEQFDKTLDSLEAKVNRFKVAWDEFTMSILNSNVVKGFIDTGTVILETVNNITNAFGKLSGVAKLAFAGMTLSGLGKVVDKIFDPSAKIGGIIAAATGRDVSQIMGTMKGKQTLGQKITQPLVQWGKSKIAQSGMVKSGSAMSSWLGNVTGEVLGETIAKNIGKKAVKEGMEEAGKKSTGKIISLATGEVIRETKEEALEETAEEMTKKGLGSTLSKGLKEAGEKLGKTGKMSTAIAATGLALSIGGNIAENFGEAQGREGWQAWGEGIGAAGTTAATLGTLSAALAAFGASIPGVNVVVAATAAFMGLYKGLEKAAYLESDEHALEVAEANKKVAEQTVSKEKERAEAMNSLTEGLQEKYAEIDKMVKGSSEWKKAVSELNSEIAEATTQVPELINAFKMEDGVLRVDQNKLNNIVQTIEVQTQTAETNLSITDHEETVAENNVKSSDIYDDLFGNNFTKKWLDDSLKRGVLDELLSAFNKGQLGNIEDVMAITGGIGVGTTYEEVLYGISQYAGIKAQTDASQSSLNQQLISSAQESGILTEAQAEAVSGLSEEFLDAMYDNSKLAAQEGLDDWDFRERRDSRIDYAHENDLKYKRGIWGWGSKFVDENGNEIEVTDDMIRSQEITTGTQYQYGQRAQEVANFLNNNALLARAMSTGGSQLEQGDLENMADMFLKTEGGDAVFNAAAFAKKFGKDMTPEKLAEEAGFKGKENEFFSQIAKNFQSRLEERISTALDMVQMANALGLDVQTASAIGANEELQAKANDFYSQMQMRGIDTETMRVGMEIFGGLAQIEDFHGMEQLSDFVNEINFENPIEAFKKLEHAANNGTYVEKQYAKAVLDSGASMIGAGAQLQYFLRSENFNEVWEELKGITELNETIEPKDILDLADNYEVLNDLMDQTEISAVGLGKAIEMVGEGMISAEAITDAVAAALSAMDSVEEEISRGLKDAASFDPGQDENQASGFISQAYEALNANIEKGAWGNSQNAKYLDYLFGDSWRSKDATTQANNMQALTEFLGENAENMSAAWQAAAEGKTATGGAGTAKDKLGLTLDPSTGEVRMGSQVYGMSSKEIVGALQEGFGVSEQMAQLMLADFKNYSKDFGLLLSIAQNDEKEGARRFGEKADNRSEDFTIGGKQYKGIIDKAELQAAGIAAGYVDKEGETAGDQYYKANKDLFPEGEYLITDYYYEDGSRKGGSDLSKAFGEALLGALGKTGDESSVIAGEFLGQGTKEVSGTWGEYIRASSSGGELVERVAEWEKVKNDAQIAQENLDKNIFAIKEGETTWQEYIQSQAGELNGAKAWNEFYAWQKEQKAIANKPNQGVTWEEQGVPQFDYDKMLDYVEQLGATQEEAEAIAHSQIEAYMQQNGLEEANLDHFSETLGKYETITHQQGKNIDQEIAANEASLERQQQIATLREALGMGEDGVLKVTIEGMENMESTTSTVTFEADQSSADTVKEAVASASCHVNFTGGATVVSDGVNYEIKQTHATGIKNSPDTHEALLGEYGPELVQTKNGAWIAGLNGPEMGVIHKGDTVYTAEETEEIFNPKNHTLMPRFGDGLDGPSAYGDANKSGGKTSQGKNSKEWENPYDKLYNLLREIDEELRQRERLERRYEKLLTSLDVNANKIIEISRAELKQLEEEKKLQEELIASREKQIEMYLEENKDLQKYAFVEKNERGEQVLRIDWDAIDAVKNTDEGEKIETYVSQLEEWFDSLEEAEDALWDIEDAVSEIKERGKDEFFDFEDMVKEALVDYLQDYIDGLEGISDAISEADRKLIESIQQTIDKQRQDRDNQETEAELAEKQRRLMYLSQDTSGANDLEILKLQKEIDEGQQSYTDSLIDRKISDLQQQNDEAAQQRQNQIDILQSQLDFAVETGKIWDTVYTLMSTGLDNGGAIATTLRTGLMDQFKEAFDGLTNGDKNIETGIGGLVKGSQLEALLNKEKAEGLSVLGAQDAWLEIQNQLSQAVGYLKVGRQLENLGLKEGTEITFENKLTGNIIKGKVDKNGNVTDSNGWIFDNVYQGADGKYYAEGNIKSQDELKGKKKEEPKKEEKSKEETEKDDGFSLSKQPTTYTFTAKDGTTFEGLNYTQTQANKDEYDKLMADKTLEVFEKTNSGIETLEKMEEESKKAAQQLGGDSSTKDKLTSKVYLDRTKLSKNKGIIMGPMKTGGLADFTGPAWLDGTKSRPELVLNARDTKNFIQLKDILSSIMTGSITNRSDSTENNGDTYYDVDINVENLSSDYDVEKVAGKIKSMINQDARYRNNNTISLKR